MFRFKRWDDWDGAAWAADTLEKEAAATPLERKESGEELPRVYRQQRRPATAAAAALEIKKDIAKKITEEEKKEEKERKENPPMLSSCCALGSSGVRTPEECSRFIANLSPKMSSKTIDLVIYWQNFVLSLCA